MVRLNKQISKIIKLSCSSRNISECPLFLSGRPAALAAYFFHAPVLLATLLLSDLALSQWPSPDYDTPVDREGWRQVEEEIRRSRYKRYDPAFEEGKAIYKGKGKWVEYEYCVPVEYQPPEKDNLKNQQELNPDVERQPGANIPETINAEQAAVNGKSLVKLTRKTLAPFRTISINEFAKQLYDCNDLGKNVLAKLEKQEAGLVIYYLDRRFKLRLKQEKGGGKRAKRYAVGERPSY